MLINKTAEYFDNIEGVIYKKYPKKNDVEALKELKEVLNNSLQQTRNQELKAGLEIILALISHKNEDIRVPALGKLFPLINDKYIQKLIVKELKNISDNENVSESAQYSLDLVAREVHGLEIFEITFDILAKFWNTIQLKASKFKFQFIIPYFINKLNSTITPKIEAKNTFHDNSLVSGISDSWRTFNHQVDKIIPYSEEIEDFNEEYFIKHEMSYPPLQNLESRGEDSLQKLTDFYASTFMERGHLRRLIALLDDSDPAVQKMGFNALIGIVESILADYN